MDPASRIETSEVYCTITDDALWRQLIENHELAARIKQLTVADSGVQIEDHSVQRQSELLMIQAVHNAKNLDSFTWDCRAPCVSQGDEISGQTLDTYREDIWTALGDHTSLKSLKVVDHGRGQAHPVFESTVRTTPSLIPFSYPHRLYSFLPSAISSISTLSFLLWPNATYPMEAVDQIRMNMSMTLTTTSFLPL